jgi:hypothetical protein
MKIKVYDNFGIKVFSAKEMEPKALKKKFDKMYKEKFT